MAEQEQIPPQAPPAPAQQNAPSSQDSIQDDQVKRAILKMQESPDAAGSVSRFFGMMMGRMGPGSLSDKLEPQHVTQVLNITAEHDDREFLLHKDRQIIKDKQHSRDRLYLVVYLAMLALFIVFVLSLFRDKPEVLAPIISGIGGLIAGFIGGMGYSKQSSGKSD